MIGACHIPHCTQLHVQARATLGIVAHPFWYLIVLVLVIEWLSSPIPALSDAAVMSAASTDGCYGSCRLWACLTYNSAGVLSSVIMHISGDSSVFAAYAAASLLAVISACYLDMSWHPNCRPLRASPAPVASACPSPTHTEVLLLAACSPMNSHNRTKSDVQEPLLDASMGSPVGALPATTDKAPRFDTNSFQYESDARCQCLDPGDQTLLEKCNGFPSAERQDDLCEARLESSELQPDDPPFSAKLIALLRDRQVIAFLAKAMLMGVCEPILLRGDVVLR